MADGAVRGIGAAGIDLPVFHIAAQSCHLAVHCGQQGIQILGFRIQLDLADQLAAAIQKVFEKTPPELAGDVKTNGILLTGGGAKLHGLDKYLEKRFNLKCEVAENPEECVAIGTGETFNLQGYLRDCISEANNRLHG
jgi:Tfp pilus assembly PilM family ATPase